MKVHCADIHDYPITLFNNNYLISQIENGSEITRRNPWSNITLINKQDIQPIFNKVKIAILGKGVVGKSSLVYRFINKENPEDHDATIEDRYTSVEEIDGSNCEIELLDTAGEDDYQNLLDMWINYAEGFLLVFAINDEESFKAVESKRERIIKLKGTCKIILVGNKCDLENERKVKSADASELAKTWGIEYVETSALKDIKCKMPFINIASKLVKEKKKDIKNYSDKKQSTWGFCPPSCTII